MIETTDTPNETPRTAPPILQNPALEVSSPTFGGLLILIGLGLTFWGFAFDATVSVQGAAQNFGYGITIPGRMEEVVNIGKAVEKLMIFTGGIGLTLAGLAFVLASQVTNRMVMVAQMIDKRVPSQ
jgi:hypothetical protein